MRRILILGLAVLFSLEVAATPGSAQSQGWVLEFMKKTQLGKRSRKLKDLLTELHGQISPQDEKYLTELSERTPGLVIPKMQINKIKNDKGGEDFQFQIVENGQSATIEMTEANDAADFKVTGSLNKAPKTIRFTSSDGPAAMYKTELGLLNDMGISTKFKPGFQVLMAKDVMKLTLDEKRTYFKKLQQMMGAAERVQAAAMNTGRKTSSIWDLLLNEANAQSRALGNVGKPCIVAGYSSTYEAEGNNVICGKTDPNITARRGPNNSEIRCNTALFGEEAQWVALNDAPGRCTSLHQKATDAFPRTIKNQAEFDAALVSAISAFKTAADTCEAMKNNPKEIGGATEACVELQRRYAQLQELQCGKLVENERARFPDLNCTGNAGIVVPVPTQPPVPDTEDACRPMGCPNDQLQCPPEQRKGVDQCANHYVCECNPDQEAKMNEPGATYRVNCVARTQTGTGGTTGSCPSCKTPGWVWPAIAGAGIGGLLLGMFAFRKTKTKIVTNTVTVEGPTKFVNVPGPTIEVKVPVPVPVPGPTVKVPGERYTEPVRSGVN